VTLPAGQDPDDVVRSGGRGAMDQLLAEPEPLVDRLWRAESESGSLRTPEAKAGLRRRLNDHAQAITDPDVRAQYQAEFRTRFDAQYLARKPERRDIRDNRNGGRSAFNRYFEKPLEEKTKHLSKGMEPLFGRAILSGVLRHPAILHSCGEALSMLSINDPELDRLRMTLIDAVFEHPVLDSQTILTICDSAGLGMLAKGLSGANGLAFSFAQRQAEPELARRDLAMAIEALAARPQLDAALAEATARLMETWDEGGFAEQKRLRTALEKANQVLADLSQGDSGDI
jgi:DNA primase